MHFCLDRSSFVGAEGFQNGCPMHSLQGHPREQATFTRVSGFVQQDGAL